MIKTNNTTIAVIHVKPFDWRKAGFSWEQLVQEFSNLPCTPEGLYAL